MAEFGRNSESLFLGHFLPILGHLGPFRVAFWPSWVILGLDVALGHSRRVLFFLFLSQMSHLHAFFVANVVITCFLG